MRPWNPNERLAEKDDEIDKLRAALKALCDLAPADMEDWADIGQCPCYHADGQECTCSEEARRAWVKDAIRDARKLLAPSHKS